MQQARRPSPLRETFICVDVETSGPNPSSYDLLSIGACLVSDRQYAFYVELQPVTGNTVPGALAISGLSMAQLAATGVPPEAAMLQLEVWVHQATPPDHRPVFVALNAPFDWMFVNDYFHRYLGRNPFGHSALDIKAYYMGFTGVSWSETSLSVLSVRYLDGHGLAHNALQDAQDQAEIFARILSDSADAAPRSGATGS